MTFQCPSCGDDIVTRVLADSVTLIVVWREAHGLAELTRVYLGEGDAYPAEPAGQAAYKPGSCCGRRLGDTDCATCRSGMWNPTEGGTGIKKRRSSDQGLVIASHLVDAPQREPV